MLSAQSDLLTRVESWTQEVERHTRQCKKASGLAETGYMGHGTNPRSLAPRKALDEITSNLRPRKRRAPSIMPGSKDAAGNTGKKKIKLPDVVDAPTGRGRGRPRKEQPAPSNDGSMPLRQRPSSSHPILPPPTKPASAPRSRSASPRKISIDMSYLLECNPGVIRRTYKQIYQDGDGEKIPGSVRLLHQRLAKVAKNAIPSELKVGGNSCPSQSLPIRVTLTSTRLPTKMMLTLLVRPSLLQMIMSSYLSTQQIYHRISFIA